MKFQHKALQAAINEPDADGTVNVATYVQAPTPTTAKPGVPSSVVWVRALGKEEAQGIIDMYDEVDDTSFFTANYGAALIVVRAYQIKKLPPPAELLTAHFKGTVPQLKGMYYYSATQITTSVPDLQRMLEVVEGSTETSYAKLLEPFFLAAFKANGKNYAPSDETVAMLGDPEFVSASAARAAKKAAKAAAKLLAATATGTAPTAGATTTPTTTGTKRALDGSQKSVMPTTGKLTEAAKKAISDYVQSCAVATIAVDAETIELLKGLPDV